MISTGILSSEYHSRIASFRVDRSYFDCVSKALVGEHLSLKRQEKQADLLMFQKARGESYRTVVRRVQSSGVLLLVYSSICILSFRPPCWPAGGGARAPDNRSRGHAHPVRSAAGWRECAGRGAGSRPAGAAGAGRRGGASQVRNIFFTLLPLTHVTYVIPCLTIPVSYSSFDLLPRSAGSLKLWSGANFGAAASYLPFEDSFTRSFYRDIPVIKDTVPAVLLDPDGSLGLVPANYASGGGGAATAAGGPAKAAVAMVREKDYVDPNRVKGTIDSALGNFGKAAAAGAASSGGSTPVVTASAAAALAAGSPVKGSSSSSSPDGTEAKSTAMSLDLAIDRDDDEDESGQFKPSSAVAALLAAASSSGPAAEAAASSSSTSQSDASAMATRFRVMLDSLQRCGSREAVDEWCLDYVSVLSY